MAVTQLRGGNLCNGLTSKNGELYRIKKIVRPFCPVRSSRVCNRLTAIDKMGLSCNLNVKHRNLFSPLVIHRKKTKFSVASSQLSSEFGLDDPDVVEDTLATEDVNGLSSSEDGVLGLTGNPTNRSSSLDVKRELLMLSLPAVAGQAIDPLALLMETAYIGRLGPVELASAGVSISIFNIVSKLFNIPLLSVATSFVAEDIAKHSSNESTAGESTNGKPFRGVTERKQLASVSTALLLAVGIGIFEALALYMGSGLFLNLMGIPSASPMRAPAQKFLSIRVLGAPAVVVSLALQGVFSWI